MYLQQVLAEMVSSSASCACTHKSCLGFKNTWSVNKVMRLIQYNSVFIFKQQIKFVPFQIVPSGGYTSLEMLFPLFVAALEVANRHRI